MIRLKDLIEETEHRIWTKSELKEFNRLLDMENVDAQLDAKGEFVSKALSLFSYGFLKTEKTYLLDLHVNGRSHMLSAKDLKSLAKMIRKKNK